MSRQRSFNLSKTFIQIMYLYIMRNIKPLENILNNFISRSISVNEFVMIEVSEVFQQLKFQSLCHDLLFHCRFLFVFRLWYFRQTVKLIIYSFFMYYSIVNKCMTQLQKFSVFWQQTGHVEMYIILINTTNQVR